MERSASAQSTRSTRCAGDMRKRRTSYHHPLKCRRSVLCATANLQGKQQQKQRADITFTLAALNRGDKVERRRSRRSHVLCADTQTRDPSRSSGMPRVPRGNPSPVSLSDKGSYASLGGLGYCTSKFTSKRACSVSPLPCTT